VCYNVGHDAHLGDGAFAAAGQRLWNSVPAELRQPDLSLGQFRRALKTTKLASSLVSFWAHNKIVWIERLIKDAFVLLLHARDGCGAL